MRTKEPIEKPEVKSKFVLTDFGPSKFSRELVPRRIRLCSAIEDEKDHSRMDGKLVMLHKQKEIVGETLRLYKPAFVTPIRYYLKDKSRIVLGSIAAEEVEGT